MKKLTHTYCSKSFSWYSVLLWGLLIFLNLLFLIYWVGLAQNYCLHYDDVHFMWKLREYSIFEYVREMYLTRGGNFVGYGLNGIIFTISNWIGDYHWWAIIFYVLGVAMSYYAVKDFFSRVKQWKIVIAVLAIYNIYVLTVPDYAVFTWLCAMSYFLYGPAICLLLRILNKEQLPIGDWGIICLLGLFLSGTNVPLTPMVWLLMLANGLWLLHDVQWNIRRAWQNHIVRRLVFVALGMLIVYVIMFVAPGNFARLTDGNDMEHPVGFSQFAMAWVKCIVMFLYMMAFYFPYHLLATLLGFMTGANAEMRLASGWRCTLWVIAAFFVYLCIAVIPLAYLSNGFGIQRNYTQIAFFYILMWFAIGYIWGSQKGNCISVNVLTLIMGGLLIGSMGINLYIDLPKAHAYRHAHEERIEYLNRLQQDGQTGVVEVVAYPSTVTLDAKYVVLKALGKNTSKQTIYYESDCGETPNEYAEHLRRLYGWDFDIVLQH